MQNLYRSINYDGHCLYRIEDKYGGVCARARVIETMKKNSKKKEDLSENVKINAKIEYREYREKKYM